MNTLLKNAAKRDLGIELEISYSITIPISVYTDTAKHACNHNFNHNSKHIYREKTSLNPYMHSVLSVDLPPALLHPNV